MINWTDHHGRFFAGRRVLVTGGAGFIGSHLVTALGELGAHVVVLDDLSGGTRDNLAHVPAVELVEGSILDTAALARCSAGCEFVFHHAALGSVPDSIERPRAFAEVNITGTLNVLEAARAAKVKRLMFAASSSAYGDSEALPKVETMPPLPRSPYAASKVAAEALVAAYAAAYGLDAVSLRYFNIFGPRQNANSAYAAVIAAFARALLAGERPVIYGDGEQSRDFTFVANVVHANLLAARSSAPLGGAVINVACAQRITVNELARQMAARFGRADLAPVHKPPRIGDVKHSLADLSRAGSMLGYAPLVPFDAGLAVTCDWYRQSMPKR
jgi:nucleoside-diphosphate-sugar epimerase